jgi:PAS domain S-box-containing protein
VRQAGRAPATPGHSKGIPRTGALPTAVAFSYKLVRRHQHDSSGDDRGGTSVTGPQFDLEQFVQAAGDAIIAARADGLIIFWNPAAERIFGYTKSEALGQPLDLIIPERLRERHWAGYRQVMQSGRTRYGGDVLRVPAVHKDGRPLSIAFTVALLFSPSAEVQAIAAVIRDETTRWNEERALRRRVAQLEAKDS